MEYGDFDLKLSRKNPFNKIYTKSEYMKGKPSTYPYIVDVELTNICNLDCKFCARKLMKRPMGRMSEDVFHRILDECSLHRIPIRFIRWGEPIAHPKFIEYAREAIDRGVFVHTTTNGLLLNEYITGEIIDMKMHSLTVSMQGYNEETYKDLRNNDCYERLVDNVDRLVELRGNRKHPFIQVSTTIEPGDNPDEFVKYWEDKVDYVSVGLTNWQRINNTEARNYIHCREPFQKLSINWDGTVTACCGDYDNLLHIGNIMETDLYNLWNKNDNLNAIRTLLQNDKNRCLTLCNQCEPAYGDINEKT